MNRRDITGIALAVLAFTSTVAVWQLRQRERPPEFVGPPRADYTLDQFSLVALDDNGRAAFGATGPLLTRDPYSHELDLIEPHLRIDRQDGGYWTARAERGWVDAQGEQLRLSDKVVVDGHEGDGRRHARLETELLRLFPEQRQARSEEFVTISQANSILRGRGLEADLEQRRMRVLSEVNIRHVPKSR
ncbi:MAG TPA: LPS export ABC transporter periplasmic protein LptC [Xanthomonadales bacterium]|nr:LPS export ABC transporter periplasmic protein LptC [Xanthomonadales bacterium]